MDLVIPVGTIWPYAGDGLPPGRWLPCDGRHLNLATNPEYAPLVRVLGSRYRPSGKPSPHRQYTY
jgi:hypothetical protein